MNKLIYVIILLVLASCSTQDFEVGSEVEYSILDIDHEGHQYIMFDNMHGNMCVIHSPNCECNTLTQK